MIKKLFILLFLFSSPLLSQTMIDLQTQVRHVLPTANGGTGSATNSGAWINIFSGAGLGPTCAITQVVSGAITCVTTPLDALTSLNGVSLTQTNLQTLLSPISMPQLTVTGLITAASMSSNSLLLPPLTVSSLPPASGANQYAIKQIYDAATPGDCTVGGGTIYQLCTSTGTQWVASSPGGGGTVTTTSSPISGQIAQFSGSTSITNAPTTGTGSVVLSGGPAIGNPIINGISLPSSATVVGLNSSSQFVSTPTTGISTGKVSLVPGTEAFGFSTLAAGTVTVSSSAACTPSATCVYKFSRCPAAGTALGELSTGTIVPGTSFVINSITPSTLAVATTDTSSVCWQIN